MSKMLVGISGWGGRNLIWNNAIIFVSAKFLWEAILTSLYVPAPLHMYLLLIYVVVQT